MDHAVWSLAQIDRAFLTWSQRIRSLVRFHKFLSYSRKVHTVLRTYVVFTKVWSRLHAIWKMRSWNMTHTIASIYWPVLKITVLGILHEFWGCICVCMSCGIEKLWVFCLHRLLYKAPFLRTDLVSQLFWRNLKRFLIFFLSNRAHMWGFSFDVRFFEKYRLPIRFDFLFFQILIVKPFDNFEKVRLEEYFFLINVLIDKFFDPAKVEVL